MSRSCQHCWWGVEGLSCFLNDWWKNFTFHHSACLQAENDFRIYRQRPTEARRKGGRDKVMNELDGSEPEGVHDPVTTVHVH